MSHCYGWFPERGLMYCKHPPILLLQSYTPTRCSEERWSSIIIHQNQSMNPAILYTCVYIYIHIITYILCTYTYIYIIYIHIHIHIYIYRNIYIYTDIYIYNHIIYLYIYTYVSTSHHPSIFSDLFFSDPQKNNLQQLIHLVTSNFPTTSNT